MMRNFSLIQKMLSVLFFPDPPYAITSIKKVSIVAGNQALLHCPIIANPQAEIHWITPVNVTLQAPRYTISKVEVSHAGRYRCRGKNALGAAEAFLQVQVMSE